MFFLPLSNLDENEARLDRCRADSAKEGRLELLTDSFVALDPPFFEEWLLLRGFKLNFRMEFVAAAMVDWSLACASAMTVATCSCYRCTVAT